MQAWYALLPNVNSASSQSSRVKVGGNAWEGFPQARHFFNLAFSGLKEHFSRGNACFQAGNIVLSMGTQLVNLKIVKISAWLEIQGPAAKLKGAHSGARDLYRSHYLKITL